MNINYKKMIKNKINKIKILLKFKKINRLYMIQIKKII